MSFKRFISYYRPHLRLLFLDLSCATLVASLDLIFPLFSKWFINDLIPNRQIQTMLWMTGLLLALYLIRLVCAYIMGYWGHVMGTRMEADMRSDLFKHLQTLPFKFFDDARTGQLMARFTSDLREMGETAHHGPEDVFISGLMIIGSFSILIWISPLLTVMMFSIVIMLVVFVLTKRSYTTQSFRAVKQSHAEINARLENSITGIRLCKSFANERYEIGQFELRNRDYTKSWNRAYRALATFTSGNSFLTDILAVVAIGGGGFLVINGTITLGDLVAYLLYATMFITPIRRLIQFTQQLMDGLAGYERFEELMNVQPDIVDVPDAIELKNPRGDIKFKDVSFRYDTKGRNILAHFNLTLNAGEVVGLVGPSGAGKTTLTHLIPRFYDVTAGEVTIDGYNVKQIKLDSLHQTIGFVQQNVTIFYGTIYENILYGKPNATEPEIMAAAQQANIHEFIMSLPNGYGSIVGEQGVKLSQGQKQRIAIARIFLKNPPILILDEATSSLDNVTELAVQEAIEKLAQGRTTIIVAHRLSTVKQAKEILVLTDQGIVERGSHENLLNAKGVYANLYRAQFHGFYN